jgi:hypothetical protein
MLEPQLDTLHIDPGSPVGAREIDRLLLLRFAILRGQFPWTHLLDEAGFNEDGRDQVDVHLFAPAMGTCACRSWRRQRATSSI